MWPRHTTNKASRTTKKTVVCLGHTRHRSTGLARNFSAITTRGSEAPYIKAAGQLLESKNPCGSDERVSINFFLPKERFT
jgi:hypothetical protein